ncbi:MAG: hypothetical protein JO001_08285 [Alphaproteobacteria bacterium]|nr:hypothetical protein [Alphaproteobacteria bacterium]
MTTYTFNPTTLNFSQDWGNPGIWAGGVVPNAPDADVLFPPIYAYGIPYNYEVDIDANAAYTVRSLTMNADYLNVAGALTVTQQIAVNTGGEIDMAGGVLTAGGLTIQGVDIQGPGTVQCTGSVVVDSEIVGNGLSVAAASLTNNGQLVAASGNLTITVAPGGFTNLSGGTLTGGSYFAGYQTLTVPNSNVLYMNVGQTLTTDAAAINLGGGGAIDFFDPLTLQYVPIQSTLQTIAAQGSLTLGTNQTYSGGSLTDSGSITFTGGTLSLTSLTVAGTGQVGGSGTVNASIVNNGTITASYGQDLVINGSLSGSGSLQIDATTTVGLYFPRLTTYIVSGTIEINGPSSSGVVFKRGAGTLQLDQPGNFTGTISAASAIPSSSTLPAGSSYQILLQGVSLASVTGYSYAGNSSNGTLTVDTTQGNYSYNFLGNYETADFSLKAGQVILSTLPPVLVINVVPPGGHGLPAIAGTAAQYVSATEPDHPFSNVTVSSGVSTDQLTVTVTLSAAANGSLGPSPGVPVSLTNAGYNAGSGIYTMTGTAAGVTQALDTLVFTLNASGIAAGQSQTTTFTIGATDAAIPGQVPVTDSQTIVSAFNGISFAGGAGAATVIGSPGDDTLSTAAPNAFVYGDGGLDTIALNAPGSHTIYLSAPGPYGAWSSGQGLEIVSGFNSGTDHLAFDPNAYGVTPANYQFATGSTDSTTGPTFRFDPGTDYLWFDPAGSASQTPDLVAFLPGTAGLGAGNLVPAQVSFQNGASIVNATPGTTAYGEGPTQTLWATGSGETIAGGAYREQFVAQAANDAVISGAGGGFIAGLGGYDLLEGGSGADAFYFASPSAGVDTMVGFDDAGGDKILIQGSAFSAPPGFDFTDGVGFVQGPGAAPAAATATFAYDTATSYLWYDPDGTGPSHASLVGFLPGSPTLHAADIQVT